MRGKVARRIRKEVYGEDMSSKHRDYKLDSDGSLNAGPSRRLYQNMKKAWTVQRKN